MTKKGPEGFNALFLLLSCSRELLCFNCGALPAVGTGTYRDIGLRYTTCTEDLPTNVIVQIQ
jgi:hypothetical protein